MEFENFENKLGGVVPHTHNTECFSVHHHPPLEISTDAVVESVTTYSARLHVDPSIVESIENMQNAVKRRVDAYPMTRRLHTCVAEDGTLKVRLSPSSSVVVAEGAPMDDGAIQGGLCAGMALSPVNLHVYGGWVDSNWCGLVVKVDRACVAATGLLPGEDNDDGEEMPSIFREGPEDLRPDQELDDDALTEAGDFETQVFVRST